MHNQSGLFFSTIQPTEHTLIILISQKKNKFYDAQVTRLSDNISMKNQFPKILAPILVGILVLVVPAAISASDQSGNGWDEEEYREEGMASWYGGEFQGRLTANGEVFDTYKMTAAHKTLPFNTIVEVRNLNNGKTVEVRINDRGPFVEGRIIDLSYAAAQALEMLDNGVIPVVLTIAEGLPDSGRVPAYTSYTVQIGSFRDRTNARALIRKMREFNLFPELEKSGDVYRVVFPGLSENEKDQILNILRRAGYSEILIRKD